MHSRLTLISSCLFITFLAMSSAFAQKPELVVQTGHSLVITEVAFSPDGKLLASGGMDTMVKLWVVANGQELRTFTGDGTWITSVAFSPDGKILAGGTFGGKVKLWDVASGKELHTLAGRATSVDKVLFILDGKMLASFGNANESTDKVVRLWDVASGQQLGMLLGDLKLDEREKVTARGLTLSPDGKLLATGHYNGVTRLWDVASGKEVRTLSSLNYSVSSVRFSPDGKILASGGYSKVKLWDVASGKELRSHPTDDDVSEMAFSPDSKLLIVRTQGGASNKLWDVFSGRELGTLPNKMYSLTFSPDGKLLAGGTTTAHNVMLWEVGSTREPGRLGGYGANVDQVAFSPDGKLLASGNNGKVKLWDVAGGRSPLTIAGHAGGLTSVAFSPDGRILASGCSSLTIGDANNTVKLWDASSGREVNRLDHKSVISLTFSPDGKLLASGGMDAKVKLWVVANGQELRTFTGETWITSVAFSPNGKILAGITPGGKVKLWDVASGQELRNLEGYLSWPDSMAFSPDGKLLAAGQYTGEVRVWDIATGNLANSYNPNDPRTIGAVSVLVPDFYRLSHKFPITPDGKWQVQIGSNGNLDLYDVQAGERRASLIALDEQDWLVISPDGLFDGSPTAWRKIIWRFENNTFNYAPVEAFFNDFYYPGLLQEVLVGKRLILPSGKGITQVDRRQPTVTVSLPSFQESASAFKGRTVTVEVEVTDNTSKPMLSTHRATGGAQDVRLFRNGSLVQVWRGDVLKGKSNTVLEATIPILAGENRLTAYAFNRDNIKSSDATLTITGADSLKRKSVAYVLAVGVNEYANSQYNLKYAVADAQAFAEEVKNQQAKLNQYERVEVISLNDKDATKASILKSLTDLSAKIQPEDAVIIYFAGHGTAQGNRFYLIPHDLGYAGSRTQLTAAKLQGILTHSISDEELEKAVEGIDAGQMLLVIDACNSGQALEAEEKRRGPMNSKGLAQLAYEKGMYILTAAQSYQAALEASKLGHGYLTYALVEEGLKTGAADTEPKDNQVLLREWLDYATNRVPRMQEENLVGKRQLVQQDAQGTQRIGVQRPRVFYRREAETQPFIVAKP